jgi:hypothetical protein
MNGNVCPLHARWRSRPLDRHLESTDLFRRRRSKHRRRVDLVVNSTAVIVVLQQPRPSFQHDVVKVGPPLFLVWAKNIRAKNIHHPKSRTGQYEHLPLARVH